MQRRFVVNVQLEIIAAMKLVAPALLHVAKKKFVVMELAVKNHVVRLEKFAVEIRAILQLVELAVEIHVVRPEKIVVEIRANRLLLVRIVAVVHVAQKIVVEILVVRPERFVVEIRAILLHLVSIVVEVLYVVMKAVVEIRVVLRAKIAKTILVLVHLLPVARAHVERLRVFVVALRSVEIAVPVTFAMIIMCVFSEGLAVPAMDMRLPLDKVQYSTPVNPKNVANVRMPMYLAPMEHFPVKPTPTQIALLEPVQLDTNVMVPLALLVQYV